MPKTQRPPRSTCAYLAANQLAARKKLPTHAIDISETDDLADLEAFINDNRKPHYGINL
jgi:hypothetical protein